MMEKIYNEDCLQTMSWMADESIDLVVTSPPYDNLRKYNGFSFEFEKVASELVRIIKKGGVIVWIVGDETIKGTESGTSFKQALFFKNNCGLLLHDTMIYEKNGAAYPANEKSNRYSQMFEYMFVFSKGAPKTVNLIKDRKNRWAGVSNFGTRTKRDKEGKLSEGTNTPATQEYGYRGNIWRYNNGFGYSTKDEIAYEHPAIFPEHLAGEHILSWSNENDIVYDPFGGSGTTVKMAIILNRKWIMSEISKEYCNVAQQRIEPHLAQSKLFAA